MDCSHFTAGSCRSCSLIETPYAEQLRMKSAAVARTLPSVPSGVWLPPVASAESRFRNKAKMVVGGTLDEPTLGILDDRRRGIDIADCQLHLDVIQDALPVLRDFVQLAAIPPYDVPSRTGELKHLLVTASPDDELMVRFVLRSRESESRIRKWLPGLRERLPQLRVVTINLLPEHKAVTEGETELFLTDEETLAMRLDGVTLHLRPRSFFQTNTAIASSLYTEAASWVADAEPAGIVDLYCGVGGFALSCAGGQHVTGIELSADAVESARTSAHEAAVDARFIVGDAVSGAAELGEIPELVIVNPPRRGIGDLAPWLDASAANWLLYSSCNAASLAKDLAALPSFRPVRARMFDMFPHTGHAETMVLLARSTA